MQKRQSDVRRPPVPIFAAKRPRTALLAHPNNTKTESETCPAPYTGSSHAKSTNQQWGNKPSNTWQNQKQGPHPSGQQTPNPQNHQAPSWQQQSSKGNSTWQQQPNQGNSTWQQQQSNQGNSTWQRQQANQGHLKWQQQANQGNSTWQQQQSNQGHSTWQQQQQPYQQANQGPGTGTWGKIPQMNPNPTPSWQHGAQGNQPQPKYGQSVPNMGNDWQSSQSDGNQNKRQGGYQGHMQPQPQQQQQIQYQQPAGQYSGNRANGQPLKQTTIHQSFKHTITQRQPQGVPNQPVASHQQGQGGHGGYSFNKPQGQMHGNDTSSSPRYGEAPSRTSYGQQKTSTGSHQPWGMASVPNQASFTPSDNKSYAANNQGLNTPQATTSDVAKTRVPDKSLKLLSATVQGMQHWSRYREKTALIFELIGRVDSAVRNDQQSSYREFMLKDDKDQAVRCVFFEIDRSFPNLVRGHFYRCVGTYEPGNQRVRCVSIRAATETERRLHRVCVAASDRAMRDWAGSIRES